MADAAEKESFLNTLFQQGDLDEATVARLVKHASIKRLSGDRVLYREDDQNYYYLLSGALLIAVNQKKVLLQAGQPQAKQVFSARLHPTWVVKTIKPSTFLVIEGQYLSAPATDDDQAVTGQRIHLPHLADHSPWLQNLLGQPLFSQLAPDSLHGVLASLRELRARAGEIIVRQGDLGDSYYMSKDIRCRVLRSKGDLSKPVKLADLASGSAFGEESIIADSKRNATVVALQEGSLYFLDKEDFSDHLLKPIQRFVSYREASALQSKGVVVLDVRSRQEYAHYHLPKSVNFPITLLRANIAKLDKRRRYIVCCDTGARSATATFILVQHGYDTLTLEPGACLVAPELMEQIDDALGRQEEPEHDAVEEGEAVISSHLVNMWGGAIGQSEAKAGKVNVESTLGKARFQIDTTEEDKPKAAPKKPESEHAFTFVDSQPCSGSLNKPVVSLQRKVFWGMTIIAAAITVYVVRFELEALIESLKWLFK